MRFNTKAIIPPPNSIYYNPFLIFFPVFLLTGHFLLTSLLLDKLKACSPSRIVIVSSSAHSMGKMNFNDLNSEKSYGEVAAYGQSKLANLLHALELSKRLKGKSLKKLIFVKVSVVSRFIDILNLLMKSGKSRNREKGTSIRFSLTPTSHLTLSR